MKNKTLELSEEKREKAVKWSHHLEKHYSEKNVEAIEKKKNKYISKKYLKEIWDKVEFLWTKLKEKETPLKIKLTIFGAFAYLVLPIDVIPDTFPILGCLDDAAVLIYVWKTVVPYFTNAITEIVEETAEEKIKAILQDNFKFTLIRALVVLLVNITATLISCFLPFGETISKYIASFMFAASLIYSLYRIIRWCAKNGSITLKITKEIIKNKSVRKGIAAYVRTDDKDIFKQITSAFKFVDIANQMTDLDLPTLEDVIHKSIRRIQKSLILFICFYAIYIVLVYWILKPFILTHYAGMSTLQLIIYPISQLVFSLKRVV